MWMWLVLFTLPILAQDNDSEKYCFDGQQKREKLHRELTPILVPSDQVSVSERCLTVSMKPHRRELIQNFIRQHQPEVLISFSSAEILRESCKLKVEKITHLSSQGMDVTIQPAAPTAEAEVKTPEAKQVSQIQTLSDFELVFNQDVIKGSCRFITSEKYEITLNVRKDSKPLLLGVPTGAVDIINSPPPDQTTANLKTTLQLTRGSRVEVGSVVRDLRLKDQKLIIDSEVNLRNTYQNSNETIYLSLD